MAKASSAARPQRAPVRDPFRTLITPEGVDLRLRLGDTGQRAAALMLDFLILWGALIGGTAVIIIALVSLGANGSEPLAILWIAGSFALRNFYFVAFELGPRAATPGKRRMGLRVAARNGGRLTADAIFVRNAMRELELYLPLQVLVTPAQSIDGWIKLFAFVWCAVFVLFPFFNRDHLRVGDLLAGTWVVRVPARRLPPDLARSGLEDIPRAEFTSEQLNAYGIKELQVLEDVLRRFDQATVRTVAERIRAKIGYVQGDESDGAFLNAYYAALRARLESAALLGRRRADKFDLG